MNCNDLGCGVAASGGGCYAQLHRVSARSCISFYGVSEGGSGIVSEKPQPRSNRSCRYRCNAGERISKVTITGIGTCK